MASAGRLSARRPVGGLAGRPADGRPADPQRYRGIRHQETGR